MTNHVPGVRMAAMLAHEANRAYCTSIGDTSQVAWYDAPEWQQNSAMNGVRFVWDNPESTPEDAHRNWMAEKLKAGWHYGPVKDAERLTHPCILPYRELPEEQRVKDVLFRCTVLAYRAVMNQ